MQANVLEPTRHPKAAPPEPPAVDLCNRRHLLNPPKTLWGRSLLSAQNALESGVAWVSVHGDPPIYDSAIFPWVAEVEAGWQRIRAELDQVMQYRDQMPSFHEILKEVSAITTDQNWKTFFLAASA